MLHDLKHICTGHPSYSRAAHLRIGWLPKVSFMQQTYSGTQTTFLELGQLNCSLDSVSCIDQTFIGCDGSLNCCRLSQQPTYKCLVPTELPSAVQDTHIALEDLRPMGFPFTDGTTTRGMGIPYGMLQALVQFRTGDGIRAQDSAFWCQLMLRSCLKQL